jgi:hypothetical protein
MLVEAGGADSPPAFSVSAGRKASQTQKENGQGPKAPILPLALHQVDLAGLGLGPEQMSAVAELREQFVDAVGGTRRPVGPGLRRAVAKGATRERPAAAGFNGG